MADLYLPDNLYINGKIFIKNSIFQDETQIFPSNIPSLNDLVTDTELASILVDYVNFDELDAVLLGYVDKTTYNQQMADIQNQINALNIGLSNMESSLFNTNQLVNQQNVKIAELEHEIELDQEYLDYLQEQIGNLGFLNTYYKKNLVGAINETYQLALNGGGGGGGNLNNVTTDILPENSNELSIGSADKIWKEGFFGTLNTDALNTNTINGVPAKNILINASINASILTFTRLDSSTFSLTIPGVDLTAIGNNLIPTITNQYTIGTPSKVWANLYVTGITATSLNGVAISNYLTTSSNPLLTGIWTFNNLPVLGANTVYRPYNTPSTVPNTNITAGTWYCIAKINTQVARVYSDFTIQFNLVDSLNNRYMGSIRLIGPYSTSYIGQWVEGKIVYNQTSLVIASTNAFFAIRTVYDAVTDSSYLQIQPNFTGVLGGSLVIINELLYTTPYDVTAVPLNTLNNANYLYAYDIKPYIQQAYTDYAEVTSPVRTNFTQAPTYGFTNLWRPYQAPMYKANLTWDSSKWYSIVKLMTGGVSYINTSFKLRGYTYGSGGTFGQTIDINFLMPTGGQNYTNYTVYGRIVSCNTKAYMSTREAFGNLRIVQDTTDGNWYLQIQPSGTYSSLIYAMVLEDIYIFTDTQMIEPTVLPATDVLTNITPITTIQKFYTDTADENQYFNQIPLNTNTINLGSATNKWATLFVNKISDVDNSIGTLGQILQSTGTGIKWVTTSALVDWMNIPSTMLPSTTNAYDIGSTAKKWKDLYVTTIVDSTGAKGTDGQLLQSTGTGIKWVSSTGVDWLNVPSSITPATTNIYDLGIPTKKWRSLSVAYIVDVNGTGGSPGQFLGMTEVGLEWSAVTAVTDWLNVQSNIIPITNNTYTIGSQLKAWAGIYVTRIYDSLGSSGEVGQYLQTTATGTKWTTVTATVDWLNIPSNLVPLTNSLYDLGTTLKKWKYLYVTSIIDRAGSKGTAGQFLSSTGTELEWVTSSATVDWLNIPSTLTPSTTNAFDLGTPSKAWRNLSVAYILDTAGDIGTAGQYLQTTATGIKWATVTATVDWGNVPTSILPTTTNTLNLGGASNYWNSLYVTKIFDSTSTSGTDGQYLQSTSTGIKWVTISTEIPWTNIPSLIAPSTSIIYDLGTAGKRWRDLYVMGIVDGANSKGTVGQVLQITAVGMRWASIASSIDWLNVPSDISPSATTTYSLGSGTKYWNNLYVKNIFDTSLTSGAVGQILQSTALGIKWVNLTSSIDWLNVPSNVIPSSTNNFALGSSTKYWLRIYTTSIMDSTGVAGTAGQYLQTTATGIKWVTLSPTVDWTNVTSNLTASATNTYDLGSALRKWKDLYVTSIVDSTGSRGTAGQVLKSEGGTAGITWVDQTSLTQLPKMSTGITQKSIWVGTQAEYTAITTPDSSTLYFIYE